MISTRRLTPNTIGQGQNEEIAYKIDFTKWCRNGNPPTVAVVQIVDKSNNTDVTATKATGAPLITGNTITTPSIHDLGPDVQYRMNVQATIDGNVMEAWVLIVGEE